MDSPDKTAADLEWPALLDQLADRCTSRAGSDRARALRPEGDPEAARVRMRRTAEAMALFARDETIPIQGLVEIGDVLPRLARGAEATAPELHGVRLLLRTAQTVRRFAHARRDTHPALAAHLFSEPTLDRLLEALDFAIDADGGLADRASSDLAAARRKAGDMRQRVIARLDELIARYAEVLQDRYYTLRDGRYVLPVRADAHIRVPGIVMGSSASGATLFIEPRAVMSLGNQLKVAQADVEREEARILAELSERVRQRVGETEAAYEACVEADVLAAIARMGTQMDARALDPVDGAVMRLRAMRHPLLALSGAPVVANDLEIGAGRVLVISGPNAGGKTVALKCLGLAAWMARAGLPVPVDEGSSAGWFEPVLSDVGDDQSLARSLSTFSAHVTNLAHILGAGRRGAMVLLDELAGGTDPEEGSALAAAVLEQLALQGAAVAVTTHYELLKTLAVRDDRFVNASVGFDLTTMLPTFHVTLGVPGASSALAVAARYGIPAEVLARAKAMLPELAVGREEVLRHVQDEQVAAQMARHAAEAELRAVTQLRVELEAEKTLQRSREQARVRRESDELLAALRRARDEIRGAEARVRKKKATEEDVRESAREIDAVAASVALGGSLAAAIDQQKEDAPLRRSVRDDEVRPGAKVYVARLGSVVEVMDRPVRGQVRVAAGAMKLFVQVDELSVEENPPAVPVPSATPARGLRRTPTLVLDEPQADTRAMRTERNTCDVRGLRVDDAISMVDAFIDRLYGEQESHGFVLHGHGTGALKVAVREHLGSNPHVTRSAPAEPGDGGDAFTVMWVK